MNLRKFALVSLMLAGTILSSGQQSAGNQPITVNGPTVVAFYSFKSAHADSSDDSDEALADFQFYASKDREDLRKRGIQFREVYAPSFRLSIGNQISEVSAKEFKDGVGYYFIAPGKHPHIENGVMTDVDMLEVAIRYFSHPAK